MLNNIKIKIFTGNANRELSEEICKYLKIPLSKATVRRFSDGEIYVELDENIRGADVFVIQPTSPPVNDHLMELLIMIDTFKRANAKCITAVIPYYGYARQDRKAAPRVPISARLVADLITIAGAKRILTLDLHASQIGGFFDIPVDHLFATPVILDYLLNNIKNEIVIVSPDAGGVERARAIAKRLKSELAIIDKRRELANVAQAMHIIGSVEDKIAIIIDDMIDTANTLIQASSALIRYKAKEVWACATHAVFSGTAIERIKNSCIDRIIITNSIPLHYNALSLNKIKQLSIANLLGEAIRRIYMDDSVSSLFI